MWEGRPSSIYQALKFGTCSFLFVSRQATWASKNGWSSRLNMVHDRRIRSGSHRRQRCQRLILVQQVSVRMRGLKCSNTLLRLCHCSLKQVEFNWVVFSISRFLFKSTIMGDVTSAIRKFHRNSLRRPRLSFNVV